MPLPHCRTCTCTESTEFDRPPAQSLPDDEISRPDYLPLNRSSRSSSSRKENQEPQRLQLTETQTSQLEKLREYFEEWNFRSIAAFRISKKPFASERKMNKYKIHTSSTPLDIYSPDDHPGFPKYVKPLSVDRIKELLFDTERCFSGIDPREEFTKKEPRWADYSLSRPDTHDTLDEGMRFCEELVDYLSCMDGLEHWDFHHLILDDGVGVDSVISAESSYVLLSKEHGIISLPHIAGSSAGAYHLEENEWLTSEIFAALRLATIPLQMILRDSAPPHFIYPTTFISATWRQARLVHGAFDIRTQTLYLKKSRIYDFDDGIKENFDDFATMLGWLAGIPVGDTIW